MGPGDIFEGGANVLAGPIGEFYANSDQQKAEADQQRALMIMLGLNPDELAVQAAQAGPTAFGNVQEDPALRQAGMNALNRLQGIVNEGGMDPQSMDAYGQAQSLVEEQARGAREALHSQAQRRGMGGSGLQMADALGNQQAAAQRLNAAGTKTAADARSRALAAMQQLGSMSSNIRGDDYRKSSDAAAAADAIAKFNATNRQNADQYNSGMRQDVAANQATALGNASNYYQSAADRKRKVIGKTAQGVGQMGNGLISGGG